MSKVSLLLLSGLLALQTIATAQTKESSGPPPNPRRPNIILIVADGLGYGDLGCYGQQHYHTPNLDLLAKEGVKFTSYYAASARPLPGRLALLTGRDTGHLKLTDDDHCTFPDRVPTIGELLQQSGYHTGCVGEWLLGDSANVPYKRGFKEWAGTLTLADSRNDYAVAISRYQPGDEKTGAKEFEGLVELPKNEHDAKMESVNELYAKAAGNFISYNRPDQFNKHRPFFLYLPLSVPAVTNAESGANHSLDPWPKTERAHADAVVKLDMLIGQIITKLKTLKQDSNTVVFVTSDTGARNDNGSDVKFHQRAGRFVNQTDALGEGDLRAPLVVWAPGFIRSGEENFSTTSACDLVPTFLDIARAKPAEDPDGLSLWPPLRGSPQPKRHEFLFWQTHPENAVAVRMGEWKAVREKAADPLVLRNPGVDPAEKTDFAKEKPEVVAKIEEYLRMRR